MVRTWVAGGLLLFLVLTGCGPRASAPSGSAEEVESFVSSLDDICSLPGSLPGYFAPGSVPDRATLRRYARYNYKAASKPRINGSEATVKIEITDLKGQRVGEQEWVLFE